MKANLRLIAISFLLVDEAALDPVTYQSEYRREFCVVGRHLLGTRCRDLDSACRLSELRVTGRITNRHFHNGFCKPLHATAREHVGQYA
jgi:hypothetical protein